MVEILQAEDKRLRGEAEPVAVDTITTDAVQKIITDMKTAMHREADAVAIAAPQIGATLRIFVVSGKVFGDEESREDLVCINPQIIRQSRKKSEMEEGCLSVRWKYGKVARATKITIEAFDERGVPFELSGSGLVSQIIQHEIDHLNGILFTDKASDVRNEPPQM